MFFFCTPLVFLGFGVSGRNHKKLYLGRRFRSCEPRRELGKAKEAGREIGREGEDTGKAWGSLKEPGRAWTLIFICLNKRKLKKK